MRKSVWIELLEWGVFAVVALFVTCVVAMRDEITSLEPENAAAPVQSLAVE